MHILLLTELFLSISIIQVGDKVSDWSGEETEREVRGQPSAVITSQSSPHFLPLVLTVTRASEPDKHPTSTHNSFTCWCWVTQTPLETQISWPLGKSTANDLDKVRVSTTRKRKRACTKHFLPSRVIGASIKTLNFHRYYPFSLSQHVTTLSWGIWYNWLHSLQNREVKSLLQLQEVHFAFKLERSCTCDSLQFL